MLKLLYDKYADRFRLVNCYQNEREAQKDADLMNSTSSGIFHYTVVQGDFWYHVLSTVTEDNTPHSYL